MQHFKPRNPDPYFFGRVRIRDLFFLYYSWIRFLVYIFTVYFRYVVLVKEWEMFLLKYLNKTSAAPVTIKY